MGKIVWAAEVFNCHAPDTGNMEVLAKYATDDLKDKFLTPLLAGEMSSAFLMTEPDVASSDATNIETSIVRDGDEYVINGRKWFSSNAMHPNCGMYIVMGKTDTEAHMYEQQSMIIVEPDTPGVTIIRPLAIMGNYSSPEGHAEIVLKDVRVPIGNLLLGEGKGFEIAQGRLGPGRIHHCMRMIGMAQRSLELMCARVTQRTSFGSKLEKYSSIRFDIARSRCEIEQARLLILQAAYQIDELGLFGAMSSISMIKIVTPEMLLKVVDRAIQAFGGMGLTQDTPFTQFYIYGRCLRFADGPDEVHMYQLGKYTIAKYKDAKIYAEPVAKA
jgi:acyl-CoA dehydrogenase